MAGMTVADYRGNTAFPEAYAAIRDCSIACERFCSSGASPVSRELLTEAYSNTESAMREASTYLALRRSNCRFEATELAFVRAYDDLRSSFTEMCTKVDSAFQAHLDRPFKAEIDFWKNFIETRLRETWKSCWRPSSEGGVKLDKFRAELKQISDKITPFETVFSPRSLDLLIGNTLFDPFFRLYNHVCGFLLPEETILDDVLLLGLNRPVSILNTELYMQAMSDKKTADAFWAKAKPKQIELFWGGNDVYYVFHPPSVQHWQNHFASLLKEHHVEIADPEALISYFTSNWPAAETPLYDAVSALFGEFGFKGCKEIDFSLFFAGAS
jgi:hypothetical protein